MKCLLCKTSHRDTKCAFDGNIYRIFSGNNWACETMLLLRNIASEVGLTYRDDNSAGSIGVVPIPDIDEASGYIVMTWYKERGETGNALVMWDDETPRQLTEEIAVRTILAWHNFEWWEHHYGVKFSDGLKNSIDNFRRAYMKG